MNDKD